MLLKGFPGIVIDSLNGKHPYHGHGITFPKPRKPFILEDCFKAIHEWAVLLADAAESQQLSVSLHSYF